MSLTYKMMDSPVGPLKLVASDQGLVAVLFTNERPNRVPLEEAAGDASHPTLVESERQLKEYFEGERHVFSLALWICGALLSRSVSGRNC